MVDARNLSEKADALLASKSKMTLAELYSSSMKVRKNKDYPATRVRLVSTTVSPGVKSLTINAEAYGEDFYPVRMVFYQVDFSETKDAVHPIPAVLGGPGGARKQYYMSPISAKKNPVRLYCECFDFRFTWEFYNKKHEVLYPARVPHPYTRKTTTYPERNPLHLPGFCKHTAGLIGELRTRGLLKY